jgi:hypothetical protein
VIHFLRGRVLTRRFGNAISGHLLWYISENSNWRPALDSVAGPLDGVESGQTTHPSNKRGFTRIPSDAFLAENLEEQRLLF